MKKRLVTRYAMRSASSDENQRRIGGVFAELAAAKPDSVSYLVLRLADDSFVHVSFHNHGDDEGEPNRFDGRVCLFSAGPRGAPRGWRRPADRRAGRCVYHRYRLSPTARQG